MVGHIAPSNSQMFRFLVINPVLSIGEIVQSILDDTPLCTQAIIVISAAMYTLSIAGMIFNIDLTQIMSTSQVNTFE